MRIGFILSLIFAIIVTIFAIQNSAVITVNFLFTKVEISLALIIFISAIIGAIIVTFLGLRRELSLKHNNKSLSTKIAELEKENSLLKIEVDNSKESNNAIIEEVSMDKN
ncbi:LapA family protein [Clostridium sp. MSJ-11]|uniref:LapA family protein n=1 Tax=Clostridium mobile TaxID=2841512 RepID=A0ABS6EHR0_9CLOT|nr:LapA family protein [Clostridium mobile]MBU5484773.1 LapA family protein [Clostridium mobile]